MVNHVFPLQFMEEYSRGIHVAVCQGPSRRKLQCMEQLWPVRDPCWTFFPPLFEGLCPMDRTRSGAVLQELQTMDRTDVGDVCRGLYFMGGNSCQSM